MVVNSDIAIAEKRGLITEVGKTTLLNASSLAEMYPSLINVVKGGIPGKVIY